MLSSLYSSILNPLFKYRKYILIDSNELQNIELSSLPHKYYSPMTLIHLSAHKTINQMKGMPIIIKEDAKVVLAFGEFINIKCSNNGIMVKVVKEDENVVWNDYDYGRDRFVCLDSRIIFYVNNSNIKKIECV